MKPFTLLLTVALLPLAVAACATVSAKSKPASTTAAAAQAPAADKDKPSQTASAASSNQSSGVMYVPTGDAATSSLQLSKMAASQVNVGESYPTRYVIKNLTDMSLNNVTVSEKLPAGFRLEKTEPASVAGDLRQGRWNVGTLGPKETRELVVFGKAEKTGTLSSCADVSFDTSMCIATSVVAPTLDLAIQCRNEATVCDEIPVTFVVTNSGSGPARNVIVSAPYAKGLRDAEGKTSLQRNVGTLKAGESRSLPIVLKADKAGRYAHRANAQAEGDLESAATACETFVRQPALVVKASGPESAFIGRNMRYTIDVASAGDAPAQDTVVECTIPSLATYVSSTGGGRVVGSKVVWNLAEMAPKAQRSFDVVFKGNAMGSMRPTVTAKAGCAQTMTERVATELKGIPAILLEVIDQVDPVLIGETTTYLIIVTNQGSAPGTDIKLVCTIPDSAQMVSATGATKSVTSGQQVRFDALASLKPGAKASWMVKVRASREEDARFKVSMSSKELGSRPVEETEATTYYE